MGSGVTRAHHETCRTRDAMAACRLVCHPVIRTTEPMCHCVTGSPLRGDSRAHTRSEGGVGRGGDAGTRNERRGCLRGGSAAHLTLRAEARLGSRVPAVLAAVDDGSASATGGADRRHACSFCVVGVTCQYSTGLTVDSTSCSCCPKMQVRQPEEISSGLVGHWSYSVSGSPSRSWSFMDELLPASRRFW